MERHEIKDSVVSANLNKMPVNASWNIRYVRLSPPVQHRSQLDIGYYPPRILLDLRYPIMLVVQVSHRGCIIKRFTD